MTETGEAASIQRETPPPTIAAPATESERQREFELLKERMTKSS